MCALSWTGLVWDLKTPPEPVLRNEQRLGAKVINRAAEELAARFNSQRIADAFAEAIHDPALIDLHGETLRRTEHFKNRVLETSHSKHLPRRDELTAQATAIFARTSSMEEIVDRAYELLTDANPRSDKRVPSALRRS